ncbi:MAG: UDP-N-acetylglucosamine 1-carboxyvinyltransferase [Saprospiraceae bacterium]|nr:UDP-N-acetylglucosamine 1-carboxyvinyltransferase [Saprospiraceae bacterium]
MASDIFEVEGGHVLSGDLVPQGAKNEALQVLCAVILTDDKVTISNVPEIEDVRKLIDLLKGLGCKVNRLEPGLYELQADKIDLEFLASDEYQAKARSIRGSVMLMGAMLARFKRAFLPKPGGDKIGRRRLDTHFHGFTHLGAEFKYDEGKDHYYLEGSKLAGTFILMDEISVTGTANMLLAAVMAKGITTIYNAACEPYIQQLCKMLNNMGAQISGLASNKLVVEGVTSLRGTSHRVLPDMIEIGSFIGLAAMTRSDIRIKNVCYSELGIIPRVFQQLGIQLSCEDDDIVIPAQDHYEIQTFIDGSILTIYDSPWPGFTPDLMSIILVAATQARGSILIHQKMFESRLFFVDKIIDMGAQIILCDPHRATVIGLDRKFPLRGIEMTSPDIRAGVALLIAAMSASGTSVIHNIQQIDRGYQQIDVRLNAIGAKINRIKST